MRYPRDVLDQRKVLRPRYNRAGALESVALGDDTYVERIAYNAKGQRSLIALGNDVMTRYAYNSARFAWCGCVASGSTSRRRTASPTSGRHTPAGLRGRVRPCGKHRAHHRPSNGLRRSG